ncbi:MAG: Holliday junction resolvase RuvX [Pseudomonadota bacterium]
MTDSETVLAFDVGLARIGVAVGQSLTATATPLTTLRADDAELATNIAGLVAEWRPQRLLVGMPDDVGSPTSIREHIRAFARGLERYAMPIHFVDESFSSREAEARLRARRQAGGRRTQRADIDAEAARIIAEQWLTTGPPD